MTKVTIDRELLEQLHPYVYGPERVKLQQEVKAILAAPRQPEGEIKPDITTKHGYPAYSVEQHQRAIAELRDRLDVMTKCADNYSRMFEESAEECEHLKACQENAMLHMTGLVAERDTLRQQLAERDAQIASMRAEVTPFIETHWRPVERQRDRLADLLADVKADYTNAIYWEDMHAVMKRIDAALAEVEG